MTELGAPFRYRTPPVEPVFALRWRPDDPAAVDRMIAWLRQHDIAASASSGPGPAAVLNVVYDGGSATVPPGSWVLLDCCPHVLTDDEFCDTLEPLES